MSLYNLEFGAAADVSIYDVSSTASTSMVLDNVNRDLTRLI